MKGVFTGLLWVALKDLTESVALSLRSRYSYQHPYEESQDFETFVQTKDRLGLPFGDTKKLLSVLDVKPIDDRRVATSFGYPAELTKLSLRDYQKDTMKDILHFLDKGGTSFNLAGKPSSGKSVLLSALLVELKVKTLVIAHMSMLITQLYKELTENTSMNVKILDGSNTELGDVNIATSQFISKRPELWYEIKHNIGCLVLDEAESLASKTTLRIFQRSHAKYKIAISATFSRSTDNRTDALTDIVGHERFVLANPDILVPTIRMIKCNEVYPPFTSTFMAAKQKSAFFRKESIFEKVIAFADFELSKGHQILIACDIQDLQNRIAEHYEGITGILNSNTKKKERAIILDDYDKGKLKVLAAGMVVNAGLSIPKITAIIRVSFPSSPEKSVQLVGRALRYFEGKDTPVVYDLVFQGKNPNKRMQAYKKNGYQIVTNSWESFPGAQKCK